MGLGESCGGTRTKWEIEAVLDALRDKKRLPLAEFIERRLICLTVAFIAVSIVFVGAYTRPRLEEQTECYQCLVDFALFSGKPLMKLQVVW